MDIAMPDFSQANCVGADPEAFFPESGLDTELMAAKRVCSNCSIMDACLEWALRHENDGLWGGMTAAERRQLRKQKNIVLQTPHLALTAGAA